MAKIQYPNPKFWKAKDDINWKKQGENLMEVMGIFGGMLMETDWQAVGKSLVDGLKADGARIKSEYEDFMALDPAEKWDRVINGERSLGRLYRKGAMATVRREWRGIKDTAYDFWEWARMWGMLLMTFSKDLIPAMNSALWYRWMISYFCCHGFMDKNIMGLRGSNLRMSHEVTYQIFRYVAENLVFLSKADRKNGNSTELNKMLFTFDEMTMGQIAAGFPDLLSIPHQLLPMFLVRPALRHLPGALLRVRRAGHRRAARHGRLLHLLLHALRRFDHGFLLLRPPLPAYPGVPPLLPRPLSG